MKVMMMMMMMMIARTLAQMWKTNRQTSVDGSFSGSHRTMMGGDDGGDDDDDDADDNSNSSTDVKNYKRKT